LDEDIMSLANKKNILFTDENTCINKSNKIIAICTQKDNLN